MRCLPKLRVLTSTCWLHETLHNSTTAGKHEIILNTKLNGLFYHLNIKENMTSSKLRPKSSRSVKLGLEKTGFASNSFLRGVFF